MNISLLERLLLNREKIIVLQRNNPYEYELHLGEINQTWNLILVTTDKERAYRISDGYNLNQL